MTEEQIQALFALCAALDWTIPKAPRKGLEHKMSDIVLQICKARALLNARDANAALQVILPVVRALPTWPGGWKLAGEGFMLRGDERLAKQWLDRIENIRSAS